MTDRTFPTTRHVLVRTSRSRLPVECAAYAGTQNACRGGAFCEIRRERSWWFRALTNLVALLLPVLFLLQPLVQTARAQEAGKGEEASATSLPDEAAEHADRRLTAAPDDKDTVILLDEEGRAFRLPAGATVARFLKWVESNRDSSEEAAAAAPFYVAAVSLEGTADLDRAVATLDASIDVFVRSGADSVQVPLGMNEATLLENRSPEETVEFIPTDRGEGLKCRVLGTGRHTIDLQISVPIRSSGNAYRLQLSLPETAQSSLRLVIPASNISVRSDELIDVEVNQLKNDRTELIAHGLGANLNLPWQSVSVQPEVQTRLQVEGLVSADVGADGVALEVFQTVNATRGSFETLTVQVPAGYSVLSVSSPTHESLRTNELQNHSVRISLPSSTAGPVELKWLLSSTATVESDRVALSGLHVEHASRQDTFLGISVAEGFRLTQESEATARAQRIRTSSFRKKVEAQFDPKIRFQHAWRLSDPNSRLTFELDRVAARYRVRPSYELLLRGSTAELITTLELTIFRGSLEQLQLEWAGFATEEWQPLEIVEPADRIEVGYPEGVSSPQGASSGDRRRPESMVELNFIEPFNRTHGKATIRFRTTRPVTEGLEPFLLSLPTLKDETLPVAELTVRNAPDVESTLNPIGKTEIRTQYELPETDGYPAGQAEPTGQGSPGQSQTGPTRATFGQATPGSTRQSGAGESRKSESRPPNLIPQVYECTSSELEFRATVTTHAQETTARSRAALTLTDERVSVQQHLQYSVRYEELQRLRILVPAAVPAAEFLYSREPGGELEALEIQNGGLELDGVRQVRVELPQPMLGGFEVLCRYSIPVDIVPGDTQSQTVSVPLLQPAEATAASTRVEIQSSGNLQVGLESSQWRQELTLKETPSWVSSEPRQHVDLEVTSTPERATQNFSIRRSVLRTLFEDGISRTRGVYLIEGDISYLTVELPGDTKLNSVQAWWDGLPLSADQMLTDARNKASGGKNGAAAVSPEASSVNPDASAPNPDGTASSPNASTSPEGSPGKNRTQLRLVFDGLTSGPAHTLSIQYTSRDAVEFGGLNSLSLQAPQFASDVWLAETLWEIALPFDQHLFVYPQHYTPRFQWERRGVVWSRQPTRENLTLEDWLTDGGSDSAPEAEGIDFSETPFDLLSEPRFGNTYRFSSFGHQQPVRFQTMSQPAIVLAGAGLTLALGIILLRIPVTRHVLILPVVGFSMALVGLWRLEAVQLLAQPALIGLVLALVLSVFEARFKKKRTASMVTLASPSDFFAPGSSREEILQEDSQLPESDPVHAS